MIVMNFENEPFIAPNQEKNPHIIQHFPEPDQTAADINRYFTDGNISLSSDEKLKISRMLGNKVTFYDKPTSMTGVIIDPINTEAMNAAREANQVPFALLKPAKGVPVLVKPLGIRRCSIPQLQKTSSQQDGYLWFPQRTVWVGSIPVSAVEIKVPVVAIVVQKLAPDGQITIKVEPPGPKDSSSKTSVPRILPATASSMTLSTSSASCQDSQ
ncbi:unnamed protein product, partial [Timema podura]|nr:unnamed protein product [Timema podura]